MGEPTEWDQAVNDPAPEPVSDFTDRCALAAMETYNRFFWLDDRARWREVAQRVLTEVAAESSRPLGRRHELRCPPDGE
jgi:hypothetical protein